jgi:hypothetical protein
VPGQGLVRMMFEGEDEADREISVERRYVLSDKDESAGQGEEPTTISIGSPFGGTTGPARKKLSLSDYTNRRATLKGATDAVHH